MKKYYPYVVFSLLSTAAVVPVEAENTFGRPKAPVNLVVTGDDATGMSVFTWDPVTEDVDGNKIPPENVQYLIYNSNGNTIATVKENKFSRMEYVKGKFVGLRYSIRAGAGDFDGDLNDIVSSALAHSDYAVLGRDYKLPVWESFGGGMFGMNGLVAGNNVVTDKISASVCVDNQWKGVVSQDADNGLMFVGPQPTVPGQILTPFVDLGDAKNPVFVFHFLNRGEKDNNEIRVCVTTGLVSDEEEVYTYSQPQREQVWTKHEVSLAKYRGKKVRVHMYLVRRDIVSIMLDNFRFIDKADANLSVNEFKAPATTVVNKALEFKVQVGNNGDVQAEGYKVTLYRGDKAVDVVEGDALESYHTANVTLTDVPGAACVGDVDYHVEVSWKRDEIATDNSTEIATVQVKASALPVPEALTAQNGSGVQLSWQAPDLSEVEAVAVTEDFEDMGLFEYENFHLGDWSVYDGDGGYSLLSAAPDLNYPGYGSPKSFSVMSEDVHGVGWTANSGKQFMAAFPTVGGKTRSEWLISPQLQGVAQTVTMYLSSVPAKAVPYQIMYSEKTANPADFVSVASGSQAVSQWTKVSADLPATAKYFAVYLPKGGTSSAFLVDDVTYVPLVKETGLKLAGYHVYRDGERITDEPVATTAYTDNGAAEGSHTYAVSAVYDGGESATGNKVTVDGTSGIDAVEVDSEVVSVRRFNLQGVEIPATSVGNGLYVEQVRHADGTVKTYKRVSR